MFCESFSDIITSNLSLTFAIPLFSRRLVLLVKTQAFVASIKYCFALISSPAGKNNPDSNFSATIISAHSFTRDVIKNIFSFFVLFAVPVPAAALYKTHDVLKPKQ